MSKCFHLKIQFPAYARLKNVNKHSIQQEITANNTPLCVFNGNNTTQ